jgi:hypothetical protein
MIDDGKCVSWPTKVGTSYLICGKRKSYFPFQCLLGPDWPVVVIVYVLIFVINAVILYVISPLGWPPVLIGVVGALILLFIYSLVACSDPGIIYKNDYTPLHTVEDPQNRDVEDPMHAQNQTVLITSTTHSTPTIHRSNNPAVPNTMECGQCEFKRPVTARHCSYCKTCIDDLDHHCPW